MIKLKRGLDLPISGSPEQSIRQGNAVRTVAVVGFDYNGMKPTMDVQVGDQVKCGQVIFSDKKTPGVLYTAPASGKVVEINRGEKRVLQSVVIEVDGDDSVEFSKYSDFASLTREQVRENLVNSGMWTALRTRPFSKVPEVGSVPASIFVQAMDTNPLAADPQVVIQEKADAFKAGLELLTKLTDGKVFVCQADGANTPVPSTAQVQLASFAGPHPAGLPGTHVHFLDPVGANKTVWTVNYQEVIAIANLFSTGRLDVERVVALAGPQVKKPGLVRTRVGANVFDLTAGELDGTNNRVISGSIFGGRATRGPVSYLGRYHTQVSVLEEGTNRDFMGWLSPGSKRFSLLNIYLSKLAPSRLFNFNTNTNGSERAMVPVGLYEKVMPLDILPTHLLRALAVGDTEQAQLLGALELDEEDLALCTFVCPGKYEYGPILRDNLTRIEKEG
ncbi:Na(+)-translocating NADH-quinone reductase subunit A [Litoribrevibacter albus]|uniref:Na(+)-translocating NADH-quinone reductase subunit A n=1 Tax=Litoribrevibacter albus TaxID=1473156 RepID=A0AA37S8D7_9GAMM|nr:Na(+)-translocating NADH-quinone reductase subunit A [Litoribrevibacter albus]GLQ30301.1 Na(+)-translocating NADH-quinone reductase subunit A [Litoribrevibacter albus]